MNNQRIIKPLFAAFLIIAAQALAVPKAAAADSVVVCDTCTKFIDWQTKAKSRGPGYHYIINNTTLVVRLYHVYYEEGMLLATQEAVPPQITHFYLTIADYKSQGMAGITIGSSPSDTAYPSGIFYSNPYGGFSNSDAYEVAGSNTVRTLLGQNIASAITGTTGVGPLDSLGLTFTSMVLSVPQIFGPFSINVVITWTDGSKSTFALSPDNMSEAKLVPGESRDADGNRIPDASVNTPGGGPEYADEYYFDDAISLGDWLEAMEAQGVPITGQTSSRLTCTWDGQTLKCRFI